MLLVSLKGYVLVGNTTSSKLGPTLTSTLPSEKQFNGKVYIRETKRRVETRNRDACIKGFLDRSATAEHVWTHQLDQGQCWVMQQEILSWY